MLKANRLFAILVLVLMLSAAIGCAATPTLAPTALPTVLQPPTSAAPATLPAATTSAATATTAATSTTAAAATTAAPATSAATATTAAPATTAATSAAPTSSATVAPPKQTVAAATETAEPTEEPARPSNPGGPGEAVNLTGDATSGAQIYTSKCQVCHGPEGKGGVDNPGSADGTVPPLNPIDDTITSSDPKTFATNIDLFVEHGSTPEGTSPSLKMPAWGDTKTLTPQQIADVIAYIMSLNK